MNAFEFVPTQLLEEDNWLSQDHNKTAYMNDIWHVCVLLAQIALKVAILLCFVSLFNDVPAQKVNISYWGVM